MPKKSWTGAEVRFIDYDQTLSNLRKAVAEAKDAHPEIAKVWLFGSLVQGNWTAASDADLIVVVRKDFASFFDSCHYQIYTKSIPTDSLVYSESEFDKLARDPESFLAQNLSTAVEL